MRASPGEVRREITQELGEATARAADNEAVVLHGRGFEDIEGLVGDSFAEEPMCLEVRMRAPSWMK